MYHILDGIVASTNKYVEALNVLISHIRLNVFKMMLARLIHRINQPIIDHLSMIKHLFISSPYVFHFE